MVKFMLGDAIELLLLALVINGVLILLLTIDDDWGFVANGVVFDAAATTDAIEDEMLAGVVGTEMDFEIKSGFKFFLFNQHHLKNHLN